MSAGAPFRAESGGLRDYWYAAALTSEVTPKRPIGRTIFGEMLVLWRDPKGAPRCLSDDCLHRSALLSEGFVEGGNIRCPYHGWTYDGDGALVSVPSEGPNGRQALSCHARRWHARDAHGLTWVWMGDGKPDRDPFPMPYWDTPGWGAYYMVTPFQNGVTHLVENFMDVPHTVYVHRGWFRSRAAKEVRCRVERTPDSVLVTYDQPKDSIGFTGKLLNPKGLPMTHTDKFYLPNNTRVDYLFGDPERPEAAFVITSTSTPIAPFQSLVYTLISVKLGRLTRLGRALLPPYTRKVIQQDVTIMANQGRSLRHLGREAFLSTPADTLHVHIEALRDQARAKGAPLPPVTEECVFWI